MKNVYFSLSFLILFILSVCSITAQESSTEPLMFLVHEDVVYPYMADQYESTIKEFKELLTSSKVDEMSFNTAQIEYFTYTYLTPVTNFEGLASYMATGESMMEKVGAEKFADVMKSFDGCYSSHRNYLLNLRNDLSYIEKQGLDPEEGLNFRHLDYFHIIPGKAEEFTEVLKEWKALYEAKGIKQGYRVYFGGMGLDLPMVLMVSPSKSRAQWAMESDEQDEILGEDWNRMISKTMALVWKFEHKNGMMRPDLSYKLK
ncbi:MAG: hypothetical protein JSW63_09175 [Ignavibacterium sp.]|nr:MAG: hypothetical protein JSW63_09175 [Ignavibacterium sp.]